MLTRHDRTLPDAPGLVDAACAMGVSHVGFKDIGVSQGTMREIVDRVHDRGGIAYLEVVSEGAERFECSLATARALGVDCVLGGTDLATANRVLGDLRGYFPFPGRPVGHPTKLGGTAACVADDCARALACGCGGVDLLAYRATEADPLDLVRAARAALPGRRLIVAGSVRCATQVAALAAAGVDAFTVGSAVFDGEFPIRDILAACP